MENNFQFLIYRSAEEDISVDAFIKEDTVWLTQRGMAKLFDCSVDNISLHLKNIYAEGELNETATTEESSVVQIEGNRRVHRPAKLYNLDAIISVGYRVNSRRATHFRIWATGVLKEYMTKGFVLDDERLKQGKDAFGKDYFRELLERVRSIRASERRIWQQVTDIFAECSIDYDRNSPVTKNFYAMVQNKFHYAITGQTAAEIVYNKADHTKDHMGLTTWKDAPNGKIQRFDVTVAKNYLTQEELSAMARIVNAYLDLAELRASEQVPMTMQDWAEQFEGLLRLSRKEVLTNAGSISAEIAQKHALCEFEKFRVRQDQQFLSDFDRILLGGAAVQEESSKDGKL